MAEGIHVFPLSIQLNTGIVPPNMSSPLPFMSSSTHHS